MHQRWGYWHRKARCATRGPGTLSLIVRTYAVPRCGHAQRYFIFFLLFVFSLAERKNEQQMQWEVPCCRRQSGV